MRKASSVKLAKGETYGVTFSFQPSSKTILRPGAFSIKFETNKGYQSTVVEKVTVRVQCSSSNASGVVYQYVGVQRDPIQHTPMLQRFFSATKFPKHVFIPLLILASKDMGASKGHVFPKKHIQRYCKILEEEHELSERHRSSSSEGRVSPRVSTTLYSRNGEPSENASRENDSSSSDEPDSICEETERAGDRKREANLIIADQDDSENSDENVRAQRACDSKDTYRHPRTDGNERMTEEAQVIPRRFAVTGNANHAECISRDSFHHQIANDGGDDSSRACLFVRFQRSPYVNAGACMCDGSARKTQR
eukprot:CAMPEP_0170174496 /NCGR_PEP_ID=MMETSP0040_2-20121228/7726_1 /TAXON_ID=641309 /ORGANISM="Lotharella oceanica, Strain CCMP622" /LENGTH=307 /DNA_ID=CAMNT_0010416159 /DNA_START=224 /DNA_END=1148 /DNA_ORIENTATION=+